MDLELGLKISHTRDDLTSSSALRIAKDKSGPVFICNETENTFILTAHLKGYRKEHVEIDINEDGTQLGIAVEKPVQEKVMSGWSMKKKEEDTRGFRKAFRIPDGVVLSRIKAKFNEQDSTLRIFMPKVVKGVVGVGVEELKEGVIIGRPQLTEAARVEVPEKNSEKMKMGQYSQAKGKEVDKEEHTKEVVVDDQDLQTNDPRNTTGGGMASEESEERKVAEIKNADRNEKETEDAEKIIKEETHAGVKKSTETTHRVTKPSQEIEEIEPHIEKPDSRHPNVNKMPKEKPEKEVLDKCGSSETEKGKDVGEKSSTPEKKPSASEKSKLLSAPLIIAGSALLVSIVLLAINRIRNRKR